MKHDQFTLPFLDTTIVAEGFGLYGGFPTAKSSAHAQINAEPEEAELLDAPVPTKPSLPAQDYQLAGERCLAEGWKARAEDNLAAIRLMTAIAAEAQKMADYILGFHPDYAETPSESSDAEDEGGTPITSPLAA